MNPELIPVANSEPREPNSSSNHRSNQNGRESVSALSRAYRARLPLIAIAFTVFCSWLGFHIADRYGLLAGFFAAAGLIALTSTYVERHVMTLFPRIGEVEGLDPYGLKRRLISESGRFGIRAPRLLIVDLPTPFVLTAGFSQKNTRLFVSRGLLERFTNDEVSLILSYELLRLREDRVKSATAGAACTSLLATVVNAADSVLLLPFSMLNSSAQAREFRVTGPLTRLTAPVVALFVRSASPRKTVKRFDRSFCESDSRAEEWARLLSKLDAYSKTQPLDVNLADASLFLVNPLARFGTFRFAFPQPPIEDRLANLTGRFPL